MKICGFVFGHALLNKENISWRSCSSRNLYSTLTEEAEEVEVPKLEVIDQNSNIIF
jgi:hypothetical protein